MSPNASQFETVAELPGTGSRLGRRTGSKYDPFVDAIVAAAGTASPWVRWPTYFVHKPDGYALGGNISGVAKRRSLPVQLTVSVQPAVETTQDGEVTQVFYLYMRSQVPVPVPSDADLTPASPSYKPSPFVTRPAGVDLTPSSEPT